MAPNPVQQTAKAIPRFEVVWLSAWYAVPLLRPRGYSQKCCH